MQVSLLMHHFPQIREMDLNPVSLDDEGKGAVALDARVLIVSVACPGRRTGNRKIDPSSYVDHSNYCLAPVN